MKIAVYPGSFDPITMGHMDIIRRASGMFDELIVAVVANINKKATFTLEERESQVRRAVEAEGFANVTVDSYNGLVAGYVRSVGATTLVRGLRAVSDFENEFQMALANRQICGGVDTVFLVTSMEYMYLSSTAVREIGRYGADIRHLVPACLAEEIADKLLKVGV